ncbi:hypothetical protein LCGC14_0759840 [marine sediment metagenome]|uniref:Uncharacterized protein n=1 Tax=marine sediment metagenome TaxID=412755 RepID=A0A0F9Q5M5_9ZZZZ
MTASWERQTNEPARWYARLDVFRLLGPRRSIDATFRIVKESDNLTGARPGAAWYAAAKQWKWKQRAETWDEAQRSVYRELAAQRIFDAHRDRVDKIERFLDTAFAVLDIADLASMDKDEARAKLPNIRLMIRDAIAAQRKELPVDPNAVAAPEGLILSADDLLAAQRELAHWKRINRVTANHHNAGVGGDNGNENGNDNPHLGPEGSPQGPPDRTLDNNQPKEITCRPQNT